MSEGTKGYAAERLLEFILKNFGRGEVFTYGDLPSVEELDPEFFEEYKRRYEAAEASGVIMLSSVERMAMGELLQALVEEKEEIEAVGFGEGFKLKHPRPAPAPPAPPPTPPTKKYCIYCGVVIPSEAIYCPQCGGKQD